MAASGGRLDRPNSCGFCIPTYNPRNHEEYRLVGKACALSFGNNSFECLQQYTNGKFQITFRNQATLFSACASGLKYNNQVYSLTPVQDNTTVVYIRFAHYELSTSALHSALLPYGEIVKIEHVMVKEDWGTYASGTRKVTLKMKSPVPNYIRIGTSTIMCSYRGVTKTCRRCEGPDHVASECKADITCTRCMKTDHMTANCTARAAPAIARSFADAARASTSWADQMEEDDIFDPPTHKDSNPATEAPQPQANTLQESTQQTCDNNQPKPAEAPAPAEQPEHNTSQPSTNQQQTPTPKTPASTEPSILDRDLQMSSDYSDQESDVNPHDNPRGRPVPIFYQPKQDPHPEKRKHKKPANKKTTRASDFILSKAPTNVESTDEDGYTTVGSKKHRKSPKNSV